MEYTDNHRSSYSDKKSNNHRNNKNRNKHQNQQYMNTKNVEKKEIKQNTQSNAPLPQITLDCPICAYCNKEISDITSALADKITEKPVHFDCVLEKLNEQEKLLENEKITYIGQGRFAVAWFENPHDLRHFAIRRIIEWEERDKKYDWRNNIADLFSQVK